MLLLIGASFFSVACLDFQEASGKEKVILWKLNCCDPKENKGWEILKLFGWRNEGTIVTTFGYFFYLIIVITGIIILHSKEKVREQDLSLREILEQGGVQR